MDSTLSSARRRCSNSAGATPADPALPRFHQVRLVLRERLRSGYYERGIPLPGERLLAEEFGVARVTVRSALARLAEEGLVIRLRGKGTLPAAALATAPHLKLRGGLLENIVSMGQRTRVSVLEWRRVPAASAVAEALELERGAAVLKVVRVRKFKGQPLNYTEVYLPAELADAVQRHTLQDMPMLVALERSGISVSSAEQVLGAALADIAVAQALGIAPGTALLRASRVVRDESGRAIQYLIGHYHPERYEYHMQLSRVGRDTRIWIDNERLPPT
ncbi:GntR family transcriptional regulator [Verticiella sediminum]|uniref:GntR family transcriptional regulator n=1 Tax=Verticiella sediminum TaxID=1247510 RepID=A0A556A806_9BURK|nr:GntR family transcriptional regulator [Verticiella sediminum]TSH89012.1 GntR family transcriptional regulator [Verticiella sediminum]